MADENQTLTIIIKLRDLATKNLRNVTRVLGGMRSGIGMISGAVFSLQGALVGLGGGLVARSFLNIASSFEQMEIKLEALTDGRGRKTLEEINAWAKDMPVNTQEAVNAFSMMKATGLDPTLEKMTTLVDVATLFGEQALPRVSRALGQMASLGKLSAEELNQLSEVGINARGILTDAYGKTVEEIQKANIPIKEVIQTLWDGLAGKYGGSAKLAQNTWNGIMVQIKSEFVEAQRLIAEAGLFVFLKEGLKKFQDALKSLSLEERLKLFQRISDGVIEAIGMIARAVGYAVDAWTGWKLIWFYLKGLYADFSGFIHMNILQTIEAVDYMLTLVENGLKRVGRTMQLLSKVTGGLIQFDIGDTLAEMDGMSTAADGMIASLKAGEEYWQGIAVEANKAFEETLKEESALIKINAVFEAIKKKAQEVSAERKKSAETDQPIVKPVAKVRPAAQVSGIAELQAQLAELKAVSATELQVIQASFDKAEITAQQYYEERMRMSEEAFRLESALLDAKLKKTTGKEVDKKRQIQAAIVTLEESHKQQLFSIEQEKVENIKTQTERELAIKKEAKNRLQRELAATSTDSGLASQFALELTQLDQRHAEELERLKELNAGKDQIEDAFRVQQLEKDRLAADQRLQLFQTILEASSTVTGDVAEAFRALYELGGKHSKTFFRVYKTAAIAQAVIDTYKGAQAAFSSLAGIPYVGPALAVAAAGAAIAAGMARVAVIRQQSMAEGGVVPGHSPHPKADNIDAKLTAGEYVHPVSAVQHYGRNVMNAIRRKAIPRELLSGFAMPDGVGVVRHAFAAGGAVSAAQKPSAAPGEASGDAQTPLNITNITDPNVMGQFLSSKPGEQQILNIISENSHMVKTSLFTRDG